MIRHYIRQRRGELLLATVLCIASAAVSIVLLAHLNALAREGLQAALPGAAMKPVLAAGGLIAAMFLTNMAAQTFLARFGAATIADLRRDLSSRFLALDYQRLLELGKHQVTGALVADVSRVATLFLVLPLFFFSALTVLFCLVYLLVLSPPLFGVFALFMAFAVGSSLVMMGRSGAIFGAIREHEDKLFEHFRGIAEGKKELTLSAARAHHFLHDVLADSIETNRRLGYAAQKWWGYGGTWSTTMVFCAVFAVVWSGSAALSVEAATIMQFVIVALFLMNPLNYLIVASRDIAIGMASVGQLSRIGVAEARPSPEATSAWPMPGQWHTITARRLHYRYQDGDGHGFSVGPIDFTLRRGETVFLIGGNGSGKSTLALLLAGLLKPIEGRIDVDGRTIDVAALPAYRQLFTGVFSDFYLFSHVVDRHGRPAPDDMINGWLEKLDLSRKVKAVGGQLSTLDLSQGQRKRLALTQSYIDDSDIYLFDEWAADQDPEFRRYFYADLLPELRRRGKTILAITHDERYFGSADRIVKLDQGQMVGEEPASPVQLKLA